jgi:syntaxin 7
MGFDDDDDEELSSSGKQEESAESQVAELIADKIGQFQSEVVQFERLVGQIGQSKDNPELRQKIERLRGTMKTKAKEASEMLKKEERKLPNASSKKMADELKASTTKMQSLLEQAAQKERENILQIRRKSSVKNAMDMNVNNDDIVLEMEESGDDVNAALVKERNAELKKVEEDMEGLAEVVSDLNSMVVEQGEALNTVENNINETKDNVKTAVVDLGSARSYQASARKKMAFIACSVLLGLIAGGICLYLFVIKPNMDDSPAPAPPPAAPPPAPAPPAPANPVPGPAPRRLLEISADLAGFKF